MCSALTLLIFFLHHQIAACHRFNTLTNIKNKMFHMDVAARKRQSRRLAWEPHDPHVHLQCPYGKSPGGEWERIALNIEGLDTSRSRGMSEMN